MALESFATSYTATSLGLLSLLAGYVGADVAPDTLIERMLWPQRFHTGFGSNNTLKTAFLLPSGGPLHRVAVRAIDGFFKHSLQKGVGRGHMLGTAFFPDTGISYKMHPGNGNAAENELVRNGLLVRILNCIPLIQPTPDEERTAERPMRQCITVSHLELFSCETTASQGAISLDDHCVNAKHILAVISSEVSAIILSIFVSISWSPLAALVFLAPFAFKLLATVTALPREDLVIPGNREKASWSVAESHLKFEIHVPGEGFQVISGPAEIILPFFRHYGHPIRCRWREVTQMLLVGAIGACYPVTQAATILFMPLRVQALWMAYQMYIIVAMLAARYAQGELWGSTEERVAQALADSENLGKSGLVTLRNRVGAMIEARITRTLHGSYTDGKIEVARIVAG